MFLTKLMVKIMLFLHIAFSRKNIKYISQIAKCNLCQILYCFLYEVARFIYLEINE